MKDELLQHFFEESSRKLDSANTEIKKLKESNAELKNKNTDIEKRLRTIEEKQIGDV